MNNFNFYNPTRLLFGKESIHSISKYIDKSHKILLTFGGGSVKKNGIYDEVTKALEGYQRVEFWGVESNPSVQTVRKAIELARKEQVSFILAIGGGSVIDATKLIAVAIHDSRDAWQIVREGMAKKDLKIVPYATVLTLPATGSEMNRGSVISNTDTKEKFAFSSIYPTFSILDPRYTYSLPQYQLSCGIADSFIHVIEQYLTTTNQSPLMDRWAEGILSTLVEQADAILKEKDNYDARANFMLCATMALNGFISMGVSQDWATHRIGHEITALTGLTHGHTLSIVLPALLRTLKNGTKREKLLQYGLRIWHIDTGTEDERIDKAIDKTEAFFNHIGLTTTFSSTGLDSAIKEKIVQRLKERKTKLGENMDIDYTIVAEILNKC